MAVIGRSLTEGELIQCDSCLTIYSRKRYKSCPHCFLRRMADSAGKNANTEEEWIHIGGKYDG